MKKYENAIKNWPKDERPREKYRITDPEEQVRDNFYLELINKYKYPKKN